MSGWRSSFLRATAAEKSIACSHSTLAAADLVQDLVLFPDSTLVRNPNRRWTDLCGHTVSRSPPFVMGQLLRSQGVSRALERPLFEFIPHSLPASQVLHRPFPYPSSSAAPDSSGTMEHRIVYGLAVACRCVGQTRTQGTSTTSRSSVMAIST